jgi:signal transduction histidine kinase
MGLVRKSIRLWRCEFAIAAATFRNNAYPYLSAGKITFGYYAISTLILGLSLLAVHGVASDRETHPGGERVSEFFDATLELRRFEKNYFLYQQEADYGENLSYVDRTRELLHQHSGDFTTLASPEVIAKLRDNLDTYPRLMAEYAVRQDTVEAHRLFADRSWARRSSPWEMSSAERKMLQSSLDRHRNKLIISIGALTLLIVLVGQVLSRMVAKPLKDMEESMEAVARGKLDKLLLTASDREIESLTNAFNRVLRELELRQKHLVRSEKLVSLGTLLSGVAHELNNPLSNISTSCQILLEEDGRRMPASAGISPDRRAGAARPTSCARCSISPATGRSSGSL